MQHITALTIQQFRGLQDLHLANLGQINLLVGGNNSGKTSVLEAIATYCRPLDPWEWMNAARSREIKSSRIPVGESLKWLFPQPPNSTNGLYQGTIALTSTGAFPMREVHATLSEVLVERSLDNEGDTAAFINGFEVTVHAKAQLQLTQPEMFTNANQWATETLTFQWREDERFVQRQKSSFPMLPVNTISPHAHRVEQLQIQRMSEATIQELKALTLDVIRSFDAGVQDIVILSQSGVRPMVYIRHQDFGLAPLSIFGDGMRRILLLATSIALCKDGVLLIDELEISLHTQVLQRSFAWLVQACQHHHIQLFATTHSLETLDALLAVSKAYDTLVVHRLAQREHQTTTTTLDTALLTTLREELGQEVRW